MDNVRKSRKQSNCLQCGKKLERETQTLFCSQRCNGTYNYDHSLLDNFREHKECPKCNRFIIIGNYSRHVDVCGKPKKKYIPKVIEICICKNPNCNKEFERRNKRRKAHGYCSQACLRKFVKCPETEKQRAWWDRNTGYKPGSGRGKSGWYKGIWCDSTWELAFVIYCLTNGKLITRNAERFTYLYEGVTRKYIPDFIVDGELIEVKGYMTEKEQAKIDQCPHIIKLLGKVEMKSILEFAGQIIGKDLSLAYDQNRG